MRGVYGIFSWCFEVGKLGGDGFYKIENPTFWLVRLRRPIAKDRDGSLDVVPIHVPLVAFEPMGSGFDVEDFDGHRSAQGNGFVNCGDKINVLHGVKMQQKSTGVNRRKQKREKRAIGRHGEGGFKNSKMQKPGDQFRGRTCNV
jgi:hypothetical protein